MRATSDQPGTHEPHAIEATEMVDEYINDIKRNPRLLIQAIAEFGTMQDISILADRLQGIDIDAAAQAAAEQQFQRDTDLCERYESDQFYQNLGWERAA